MRFRRDDRAAAVQVGAVIFFGFLILSLTVYQVQIVPQENRQVEFRHSLEAQSQMEDLRNAVVRTAATGSSQPQSLTLGTTYPARVFAINPPPASGSLRTGPARTLTVTNLSATGETGDYWTGDEKTFATRGLVYRPEYAEYRNPPSVVYGTSVLYHRVDDATLPQTEQRVVDGNTITLIALNGSLSAQQTGTVTVDPRGVSAPASTVTVHNETSNVTLTVPTALPRAAWQELVSEEMAPDGHVLAVEDATDGVRLVLEPGTYELRLAKVGVGTDVTATDAHYVTDVDGANTSVGEGSRQRFVLEVRDRFDNPVSGVSLNASLNASTLPHSIQTADQGPDTTLTGVTSDADGQVAFTYRLGDVGDVSARQVRLNVSVATTPTGPGFDASTVENVSVPFTAVNTDGSGTGGGTGQYDVGWDTADIVAQDPAALTYFEGNDTLRVNTTLASNKIDMVANTTSPTAQVFVDMASSDLDVFEFDTNSEGNTDADGELTIQGSPEQDGTATVYASAIEGSDALTIKTVSEGGGNGDAVTLANVVVNDNSDARTVRVDGQATGTDEDGDDDGTRVRAELVDQQNGNVEDSAEVSSAGTDSLTLNFDLQTNNDGHDYTLRLTATDADGNTATQTRTITPP